MAEDKRFIVTSKQGGFANPAVKILVDRIENGGEPCHEFVPYSLLQRESTRRIDE